MSTYSQITRHPQTGNWEKAKWIDDYFGHHIYGVHFESDGKVYATEQVERAQLKEFWVQDVLDTIVDLDIDEITFLNLLQDKYKARWERDPAGGEGVKIRT